MRKSLSLWKAVVWLIITFAVLGVTNLPPAWGAFVIVSDKRSSIYRTRTPPLSWRSSFVPFEQEGRRRQQTTCTCAVPQILADLTVVGVLGFAIDPLIERIYNETIKNPEDMDVDEDFEGTLVYGVVNGVSIAARVYGFLLVTALVVPSLLPAGSHADLPLVTDALVANPREVSLKVALTVWGTLAACTVKRTLLLQSVSGKSLGRVTLYDRLIDFALANVALLMILNELQIDIGMGVQSVFAAGGVGAIFFSLASKDLASQIVGGLVLSLWDAFDEGDVVRLGDGTEGTVRSIGLVETDIAAYDNTVIKIPNSQIYDQRVINLSRIKMSQVKQELRFKYSDLNKLETVLQDIKNEIEKNCPNLITDGTRPFQAVLERYEPDHVEVLVNCHFKIPPTSADYIKNRQEVLLAIARAVERNGIDFALPSIYYETRGHVGGFWSEG